MDKGSIMILATVGTLAVTPVLANMVDEHYDNYKDKDIAIIRCPYNEGYLIDALSPFIRNDISGEDILPRPYFVKEGNKKDNPIKPTRTYLVSNQNRYDMAARYQRGRNC